MRNGDRAVVNPSGPASRTWEHGPREKPAADEAGYKNSGLAVRGGGRSGVGRRLAAVEGPSRGTGWFQSGVSADFSSETELAAVKGPSWFQSEEGASLSEETGLAPVRVRGWLQSRGQGQADPRLRRRVRL